MQKSLSNLNTGQSAIFSTGLTINLIMAAYQVSTGILTPGDFVMIQALFLQLQGPIFNMGMFFMQSDQASVDTEDLAHVLQLEPVVKEKPDAKELLFTGGNLEFNDVSFRHYGVHESEDDFRERQLFENFNLKIEAGTTNAIVGESGFGKTTIMSLILRFFDPQQGQITIDGQDLRDLKHDSFRKHISIVPQNGILFNDTVLYNLQYGNPDATMEEIERVAKMCCIHDTIMRMPEGY